jgi:hypothetical protein
MIGNTQTDTTPIITAWSFHPDPHQQGALYKLSNTNRGREFTLVLDKSIRGKINGKKISNFMDGHPLVV